MPQKIIIDTDPGQDDAVALLLAFASPELEVLGITAVAGNVPLALTERNARQVRELAGAFEVPVCAGRDRPLTRPLTTAEHVHGKTGLDGIALPQPRRPLDPRDGVAFLIETLRRHPPGEVTLCALGPLTNLAAAFVEAPDIVPRLARVVLMGGAYFEVGNITPASEFNIHVDPEAAEIVFGSGAPLVVMPLDVTHRALATPDRVEALREAGRVGPAVASWLSFSERFDRAKYGADGAPLHDPTVIAWLLRPGLFRGREINVEIETEGRFTTGMTVADWWHVSGRTPNALFMNQVDAEGFFALLTERLARL